jgi:hypothetical protein
MFGARVVDAEVIGDVGVIGDVAVIVMTGGVAVIVMIVGIPTIIPEEIGVFATTPVTPVMTETTTDILIAVTRETVKIAKNAFQTER